MDVSDGLVQDLSHVCRASGLGAELEASLVPLSAPARAAGPAWLETALTGGDDYEVLLTAPPDRVEAFIAAAAAQGIALTRIGRMVPGPAEVRVLDVHGAPMAFTATGWTHF
jgi:thiamine-monophosphate kinase